VCKKSNINEGNDNPSSSFELHLTITEEYTAKMNDDKTEIPHLIGKINMSKKEQIILGTGVCVNQG